MHGYYELYPPAQSTNNKFLDAFNDYMLFDVMILD